jgi:hypothetical protein
VGKTLDLGIIFEACCNGACFQFLPLVRCAHLAVWKDLQRRAGLKQPAPDAPDTRSCKHKPVCGAREI